MSQYSSFFLFVRKILPIILFFFLLWIFLAGILLYFILKTNQLNNLEQLVTHISEDIIFKNDVWDISLYNSDSRITDNNAIYVITTEGYVIERSKPIHGLLDLSRYTTISNYNPQTTITTVTNEKWRVYSVPLIAEDKPLGTVMVSKYNPEEKNLNEIDKQISETATQIQSKIKIKDNNLDISSIDIRTFPFDINFQVVNRFNRVILQSNNSNSVSHIPSFLDRSYVDNQLKSKREKVVEDSITHKKYLILTQPIYDHKNLIVGVIVVGAAIDGIYSAIISYTLLNLLLTIFLTVLGVPAINFYLTKIHKKNETKIGRLVPKTINFTKKACKLLIDQEVVDIPYASFQYYFCNALFAKPNKKWEADELLEIFGEDLGVEKWRKVYDTMVALNKKTADYAEKIFIVKDKRYYINPNLIFVVRYTST